MRRFKLEKKHKFLLHSIFVGLMILLFSFSPSDAKLSLTIITYIVVISGIFVTHYPNINWQNFFYTLLPPFMLTTGSLLSFYFFPNLSFVFKFGALISVVTLFYIYSLVNNVFLVVEEKQDIIPLYRVASTSAYIILSIISIPLFAGVFKISTTFWMQSLLVSISAIIFILYFFWITKYDVDAKNPTLGESFFLVLFTFFIVFVFSSAVSFVPTESFLRGIFTASGLMFSIGLVQNHLKNSVDKSFIRQFFIVFTIFLIVLVVFNP